MKVLFSRKLSNGSYFDITICEWNPMLDFKWRYSKKHGLEFAISVLRLCIEKVYTPFQ